MQAPRAARQGKCYSRIVIGARCSVTTVSISYHAKLLLARASAEQSVVDQLQAQLDAFQNDESGRRFAA